MILICEECGKKYQTRGSLKKDKAKFKCRSCGHVITIFKSGIAWDNKAEAIGSTVQLEEDGQASEKEIPMSPGEPTATTEPMDEEKKPKSRVHESLDASKVRFGLSAKVITVMLLVSLVPLLLFWVISYKQIGDQIRNDTERVMAVTAQGLGDQVDEWIDKNVLVLKAMANTQDIISMQQAQQEPILKSIQKEYPWMYLVFTVGMDGMNRARDDGKPLKDYSDRQYYKDIISGKDMTWQTLIGKTSKKPALVLAVPIVHGERGLVGVMAAAMNIDEISRRVANWKEGETGFAFLVDEKRKVVAHQIGTFVLEQKNLNSHPLIAHYETTKKDATIQF